MPEYRIAVERAEARVRDCVPRCGQERVPLDAALGRILAEPVRAERDQPPFDRVTMDGIAVNAGAVAGGRRRLRVAGTQAAGGAPVPLEASDACIEIMTGAMLPPGADAVVPVERIRRSGDAIEFEAGVAPAPGQNVHRRGSDHRAGAVLLEPGARLGPPELAVLTLSGHADVAVVRAPRIAVVSTGNELRPPGAPIEAFQVRSSNDLAIAGALAARGVPPPTRAWLPDDPATLSAALARLHDEHDWLLLSGGVSMGKYDYVPQVLDSLGVELVFHRILQRPGLPMWFGVSRAGKPVFALPGNPVSSLVCAVRYVGPALDAALGVADRARPRARLATDVEFAPDLTGFLPVALALDAAATLVATPRPTNTSGDFSALAGTDGFVELGRGRDHFPAGSVLPLWRWTG